jgi:integrase
MYENGALDPSAGVIEHDDAAAIAGLSDSFVFASPTGAPVRDGNFRHWVRRPALARAALPGIDFHDLRHTAFLRLRAHPGPCSGAGGVVFAAQ